MIKKSCHNCGEILLDPDYDVCNKCHRLKKTSTPGYEGTTVGWCVCPLEAPSETGWLCSRCKTIISPYMQYCPICILGINPTPVDEIPSIPYPQENTTTGTIEELMEATGELVDSSGNKVKLPNCKVGIDLQEEQCTEDRYGHTKETKSF